MKAEHLDHSESEDLEIIAHKALQSIPEELRQHIRDVVIRIDDFPAESIMQEMRISSPYDLLGLYQGISLDRKSVSDPIPEVDMIFLYRQPILVYAEQTGEALSQVVRHVLIHEIGHHFGFSDDDMRRIERQD